MPQAIRRRWDRFFAIVALVLVVGLWLRNEQPWRHTLVVWCCGSNYESQVDYGRQFGQQHGCKVLIVGAPIQYLLELAARTGGRRPVVLAGRAGPGWEWIRRKGLLAHGPVFFGFDPYVIVVPLDNPGKIKSEADLGGGVIASMAPLAMRPKGKCIGYLLTSIAHELDSPWLAEAYYYAAKQRVKCGRLLFRPLKQGKAFVTITQRSQTTLPEAKGLKVIEIDPKYQVKMKKCRASIPQCAGVISKGTTEQLPVTYVDGLASPKSKDIFERHGYYHITNPKSQAFKPLHRVYLPKQPQQVQQQLAEELMKDGMWGMALRRWLKIVHVFGPSPYDAKATYMAGYCAMQMGLKRGAAELWKRCARIYPRRGIKEWAGPLFLMGLKNPDPKDLDEKLWADKAREELAKLKEQDLGEWGDDFEPSDVTDFMLDYPPVEIRVIEADLPKGSRRNLAVAEDELMVGAYDLALKDYNKVYTLNSPNEWAAMAMCRAGECAWLLGNKAAAVDIWNYCKTGYNGQPWGDTAGRLLYLAGLEGEPPTNKAVSPQAVQILEQEIKLPEKDTFVTRGLSDAVMDFRSANLSGSGALKECFKVLHKFYKGSSRGGAQAGEALVPPGAARKKKLRGRAPQIESKDVRNWRAQSLYWAGIVLCWMAKPAKAVMQWRRVMNEFANTPFAEKARDAIAKLKQYEGLSPAQKTAIDRALKLPLFSPHAQAQAVPAASEAEMLQAWRDLNDHVPDKHMAAVWHHIGLELFICGEYKEALHSFLKVLTVVNLKKPKENKWKDEALYYAGLCLEHLDKPQRARARWQELVEKYPQSKFAQRARQKLAATQAGGEVSGRG